MTAGARGGADHPRPSSTSNVSGPIDVHRTASPAETEAFGAALAARLEPGDVVLIAGELGAGKTTLVRGACRALGVAAPVTSPTFTIGQRYAGSVPVSHLDLFRLDGMDREEPELLGDYLDARTVAFIEWPPDDLGERDGLLEIAWRVRISHAGQDRRVIEIVRARARSVRPLGEE